MGITAQVAENLSRAAEWTLGIDNPFEAAATAEKAGELRRVREVGEASVKLELTPFESLIEVVQEEPLEQT
jgi:hypothetical protein